MALSVTFSKFRSWQHWKLSMYFCAAPGSKKTPIAFYVTMPNVQRNHESKMSAWHIHSYGGLEELQLSTSSKIPKLRSPDDVLVEVAASSVNPIDIAMMGGYGAVLLNTLRQLENCALSVVEFPLSLGRDFSGTVIGKGYRVSDLKVGSEVWGVLPPHQQGCHAEIITVNKNLVKVKPKNLTHAEAGSLLYTGVTAWSALKITGDLYVTPARGKRVLLLGASGGVGLVALQLLKAWGAQVVATCRSDAHPLVESYGADSIIDYTHSDYKAMVKKEGKYDIVLDAAGVGSAKGTEFAPYLKDFRFSKYITLKSPLLRNVDQYGLFGGMMRNAVDLVLPNLKTNLESASSTIRWGFFLPVPDALQELQHLVEDGKLFPVIEQTYSFNELPLAYERVMNGHLRGKVVIDIQNKEGKAKSVGEAL